MADQDSITTPANARPVDELARLAALRGSIERGLEAMLELLDALDGDPELEDGNDAEPDNDDEPTLGWGAHASQTHLGAFGPAAALDGELEEDDPPEPSLASPERHPNTYGNGVTSSGNQLHWADGAHSGGKARRRYQRRAAALRRRRRTVARGTREPGGRSDPMGSG